MYIKTIEEKGILGWFTDREGSSKSPFMNVAVRKSLGLDDFPWVRTRQIHEDKVAYIEKAEEDMVLDGYDALITDKPGIVLVTVHADCIPVQLYDSEKKVIAAIHAGWKGTYSRIAYKAAMLMRDEFACQDIKAYIGPGISLCCFEVGDDVAEKFMPYEGAVSKPGDKYHIDLKLVNKIQLKEAGVSDITVSNECTFCNERYVSYRREGGTDQRMGSIMVMLP